MKIKLKISNYVYTLMISYFIAFVVTFQKYGSLGGIFLSYAKNINIYSADWMKIVISGIAYGPTCALIYLPFSLFSYSINIILFPAFMVGIFSSNIYLLTKFGLWDRISLWCVVVVCCAIWLCSLVLCLSCLVFVA